MKQHPCLIIIVIILLSVVTFAYASDCEHNTYTLLECAQTGIKNSFKLKVYDSKVRENQAKVKETLAKNNLHIGIQGVSTYQNPELDISLANLLPIPMPGIPMNKGVINPIWYHNYNLSISKLITSFGKVEAAAKLMEMSQEMEKIQKEMEMESLLFNITQGFYGIIFADQMLEIASADLKSWEEQYKVSESLYNRGVVARYDRIRVQVAVQHARDQVETSKKNVEMARENLRTLMGLSFDEKVGAVKETSVWNGEEMHRLEFSLEKWRKIALADQPAIHLGKLACQQGQHALQLAMLDNAPVLNFQTSYARLTKTFIGAEWSWQNTLSLSLPLMDGGERKSKIAQWKEIITQAELNLADTERNVLWNVEQAYLELHNLFPKLETAKQEVAVSEEGFRVAKVRYKEGLNTMVEVIDSQSSLIRAKIKLQDTLIKYYSSMAALSYAAGILRDDIFLLGRKP